MVADNAVIPDLLIVLMVPAVIKKSKTIKTIKMVADNADTRPLNGPIGPIGLKKIPTTLFLIRRLQIQRSAKMPPMGSTWRTSHWWHFLLAAVDVCLMVEN